MNSKLHKLSAVINVAFAIVLMLTATLLPHHHHGDAACMAIERCADDGAVNDPHTGHAGDNACQGGGCTVSATAKAAKQTTVQTSDSKPKPKGKQLVNAWLSDGIGIPHISEVYGYDREPQTFFPTRQNPATNKRGPPAGNLTA